MIKNLKDADILPAESKPGLRATAALGIKTHNYFGKIWSDSFDSAGFADHVDNPKPPEIVSSPGLRGVPAAAEKNVTEVPAVENIEEVPAENIPDEELEVLPVQEKPGLRGVVAEKIAEQKPEKERIGENPQSESMSAIIEDLDEFKDPSSAKGLRGTPDKSKSKSKGLRVFSQKNKTSPRRPGLRGTVPG